MTVDGVVAAEVRYLRCALGVIFRSPHLASMSDGSLGLLAAQTLTFLFTDIEGSRALLARRSCSSPLILRCNADASDSSAWFLLSLRRPRPSRHPAALALGQRSISRVARMAAARASLLPVRAYTSVADTVTTE